MFQVAGGSLGLGIATAVFTARAGDGLSSHLERVVRASFESGFQATFVLVAVLALAGFLVTVLFVGRPRHAGPEGERLGADRAEADERVSSDR